MSHTHNVARSPPGPTFCRPRPPASRSEVRTCERGVVRGTPGILEPPAAGPEFLCVLAATPGDPVCEPGGGKEEEEEDATLSSNSVSVNGYGEKYLRSTSSAVHAA